MSEKLISEKWLREYLDGYDAKVLEPAALQMLNNFYAALIEAPAVDVVPVRHGKWIKVATSCGIDILECSECHKSHPQGGDDYCRDCGAKMDGGVAE